MKNQSVILGRTEREAYVTRSHMTAAIPPAMPGVAFPILKGSSIRILSVLALGEEKKPHIIKNKQSSHSAFRSQPRSLILTLGIQATNNTVRRKDVDS